jgi:uncharacterized protein (DUF1697 family)
MPRHVAFLRAINVGGRFVRMNVLSDHFRSLGCTEVSSFINSGNLVFRSPRRAAAALEAELERGLAPLLGFQAEVFLRSPAEVCAVAAQAQRLLHATPGATVVNAAFLKAPLDADGQAVLAGLATDIDHFTALGREVYWTCRTRQSESTFSNAVFERRLARRATFRRHSMLQQFAASLGP